jgi:tetratricopeptide (TPR) repeat protein
VALPDLSARCGWDERLRQVPDDPGSVERAIASARAELAATADSRERCRLHGYPGNAARLLGRDEEAVAELGESLALAEELGDEQAAATARTRLGEAHRCFDRLDEAEACLRVALDGPADVQDFALQHLGKTLLDAGRTAEAGQALEAALERRRAKGDPALVASTEQALALARERVH